MNEFSKNLSITLSSCKIGENDDLETVIFQADFGDLISKTSKNENEHWFPFHTDNFKFKHIEFVCGIGIELESEFSTNSYYDSDFQYVIIDFKFARPVLAGFLRHCMQLYMQYNH